ncbi:hypothetical protein LINPERHAP2_LOCUS14880, partial [Linum perenne]
LFPSNSLHFVHSGQCLHWLSQVPPELTDKLNPLRKGLLVVGWGGVGSGERVTTAVRGIEELVFVSEEKMRRLRKRRRRRKSRWRWRRRRGGN